MIIHQFYDKGLAHGSYGIISEGQMAVIDPARNPRPYHDFATAHGARIIAVIETHPHADFISSHLELHQITGATIYVSKLLGADYPHHTFDEGDEIKLGKITLKAISTPGHSPDSICIMLIDGMGIQKAVFTGDTLFVGDVGRPDLRESAGNVTAKKEELAKDLYRSTRQKLMTLPHDVLVYPAHGPGSLCGKNMSPELHSTIGYELRHNYALQLMSELDFVKTITEDQPFVPRYFGFDVELNKQGAKGFKESIAAVPMLDNHSKLEEGIMVIDTRPEQDFKAGHIKGSFNIQNGDKFETWLGSIINPGEPYYLIAKNEDTLLSMITKAAKIGYEQNIKGALTTPLQDTEKSVMLNFDDFTAHPNQYTIIDVRNAGEYKNEPIFERSINIPLPVLRERLNEIPTDKTIIVHCAAGYRSAAGSSIITAAIHVVPVYDMGEAVLLVH